MLAPGSLCIRVAFQVIDCPGITVPHQTLAVFMTVRAEFMVHLVVAHRRGADVRGAVPPAVPFGALCAARTCLQLRLRPAQLLPSVGPTGGALRFGAAAADIAESHQGRFMTIACVPMFTDVLVRPARPGPQAMRPLPLP
jgi:hypothetical protein